MPPFGWWFSLIFLKDLCEGCFGRRGAGEERERQDVPLTCGKDQRFDQRLDVRDFENNWRRAGMDCDMCRCAQGAVGVEEAVRVAVRCLDDAKNEDQHDAQARQQTPCIP